MTVYAFWFDSNKELNYPFLGSWYARYMQADRVFKMISRPAYIGTTIVVPDDGSVDVNVLTIEVLNYEFQVCCPL